MSSNTLMLIGGAIMALAVVCAVIMLFVMGRRKKRLERQLQMEYGRKGGKNSRTAEKRRIDG